jgi:uncharacterized protein YdeI (YjbR/CyaY-like superfamily)
MADYDQVLAESRAQWRAWLAEHHATVPGAWLVRWKKASGGPYLPYGEAVEEALCFGWIDGQARPLDDRRWQMLITPRRPGSAWSRANKERIERLSAEGRMEAAGLAAVERAKADGSWWALDAVEDLIEPAELRAALDRDAAARREWDAFPRSARRAILEWIVSAKRPETRARRVEETARLAAQGIRANQRPRP